MNTTFWIQLLGSIFGISMSYYTFIKYKKEELKLTEWIFWTSIWVVMILVSLIPSSLDPIIGPLNFYRRLDFFVVVGFFVLLAIAFYNYGLAKKNQKNIEKIVRKIALNNNINNIDNNNNHNNEKKDDR